MTDAQNNNRTPGEVPWTEENFNSETAGRLVVNLRSEVKELKEQLATAKAQAAEAKKNSDRIIELESELAATKQALSEAQANVHNMTVRSTKEKILNDRNLPLNLVEALAGDSEEAWTQMADMLSALRVSDTKQTAIKPDPVQQADSVPSGDAKDIALAKQLGLL